MSTMSGQGNDPSATETIQDEETETYDKTGTMGLKGGAYQCKVVMLMAHRGIKSELKFRIATEMRGAGKFDDIVYKYVENNQTFYRFIQVKHVENETKSIAIDDLLTEGDGDFALLKYFNSYRNIIKSPSFSDGIIKDFVIYTNINLKFGDGHKRRMNRFFEPIPLIDSIIDVQCERNPRRYKLRKNFLEREIVLSRLRGASDICIVARHLAECVLYKKNIYSHGLDSVIKCYYHAVAVDVIDVKSSTFHQIFLDDDKSTERSCQINYLRKLFEDEILNKIASHSQESKKREILFQQIDGSVFKTIKDKNVIFHLPKDFDQWNSYQKNFSMSNVSEDEIEDFVDRLVFAVNQPNEMELEAIIREELADHCLGEDDYRHLFEIILNWTKDKSGHFLLHSDISKIYYKTIHDYVWFGVDRATSLFTGRIKELKWLHKAIQNRSEYTVISHVITGLGGIGKTELTRKYIQQYCQYYDQNVIWINAENSKAMEESFVRLAKDYLNLNVYDTNGQLSAMRSIVDDVYKFFANKKSLFVFDNAERYKNINYEIGINKFLPCLPPHANKPYIIVTSRYQKWGHAKVLCLGVFMDSEAEEFIRKGLNLQDKQQEKAIEDLCKLLQNFPLALQQAVAYITKTNSDLKAVDSFKSFEISEYVLEFKNKCKKLLEFPFPDDTSDLYTKTTFTTWKLTIDKIILIENFGLSAEEILNVMAYLATDSIPTKMFLSITESNERFLGSTMRELEAYSMLDIVDNHVRVHRLVQQVVQINLIEQGNEKKMISKAADVVLEFAPCGIHTHEKCSTYHLLLPHAESLLANIENFLKLNPSERSEMEKNYIEPLLKVACKGTYLRGTMQEEYVERALAMIEQRLDSSELIIPYKNLLNVFCNFSMTQPYRYVFDDYPFDILGKEYCGSDVRFGEFLINVSATCCNIQDFDTQKKLGKIALQIYEKHDCTNCVAVANILISLSIIAQYAGDYVGAQMLLDRALGILKETYDSEYFKLINIFGSKGDPKTALSSLRKGFNPEVALTLSILGVTYIMLDDHLEKELIEYYLSIIWEEFRDDYPETIATFELLGMTFHKLHDYIKANSIFQFFCQEVEPFGIDHIQLVRHAFCISTHCYMWHKYLRAEWRSKTKQNWQEYQRTKTLSHIVPARALICLGNIHLELGDYEKAFQHLDDALFVLESESLDISLFFEALVSLGKSHTKLGDFSKAKKCFDRLYEFVKCQSEGISLARICIILSNYYCTIDDYSKAEELARDGVEIMENKFGLEHYETVMGHIILAIIYDYLNKTEKSIEALKRCLPHLKNLGTADHSHEEELLKVLSSVHGAQGKTLDLLSEAEQIFKQIGKQKISAPTCIVCHMNKHNYDKIDTSAENYRVYEIVRKLRGYSISFERQMTLPQNTKWYQWFNS